MNENIVKGESIRRQIESNLGQLTLDSLKNFPDNIIQIDAETGGTLDALTLLKKSIRLARFLKKQNVGIGDTVTILSENRLDFCLIPIASFFIGATLAPINPEYTTGELKHLMNLAKPKIIFSSTSAIKKILELKEELSFIEQVILIEDPTNSTVLNLQDIIEGAENDETYSSFTVPSYDPKNTALILFSSGTTGAPKGVMITHNNITACIEILTKIFSKMSYDEEKRDKSDTIIGITPFFHSFGFLSMYLHILRGKRMIVFKKFNSKLFLQTIVKFKIKSLVVPPPLLVFLVKNPLVDQYDLSCLEEVFVGSSPLGKETELALKQKFKFKHTGQSYGMTETTWSVLFNPQNKAKMGSVGVIVPGMEAKVIDQDGNPLCANQEGELCIKGPMIMRGYVNDENSTRHCIDDNEWLHTGDIAYYDEEGYFFIVDRMKELIKYKGFQVAPSELEDLLLGHPSVLDAAVIGIQDEFAGELPMAFIVKRADYNISEDILEKFVADNVSSHKQLRGGIKFVNEIPRNHTGKILRRSLKQLIPNKIEKDHRINKL